MNTKNVEQRQYTQNLFQDSYSACMTMENTGKAVSISLFVCTVDQNSNQEDIGVYKGFTTELFNKLKIQKIIEDWEFVYLSEHSSDDGFLFEYDLGVKFNLVPKVFIGAYLACVGNPDFLPPNKIVVCINPKTGIYIDGDDKRKYPISQRGEGKKRFAFIRSLYNKPNLNAGDLVKRCNYTRPNKISDECKGINQQFSKHIGIVDDLIIFSDGMYSLNRNRFEFKSVRNS